jgi:hypothetical protein
MNLCVFILQTSSPWILMFDPATLRPKKKLNPDPGDDHKGYLGRWGGEFITISWDNQHRATVPAKQSCELAKMMANQWIPWVPHFQTNSCLWHVEDRRWTTVNLEASRVWIWELQRHVTMLRIISSAIVLLWVQWSKFTAAMMHQLHLCFI